MRRLLHLAAFLVLSTTLVRAANFEAGAAKSVITPELSADNPVYLAGFGHGRIATGTHDDLYARCLALQAEGRPLVLCSVDLIGLFYDDVVTIRRHLQRLAGPGPFLIVASTHTHAGPDTLGLYGPKPLISGIDPHYLDWVDLRVASTAAQALRALEPAHVVLGRDDRQMLGSLQGVDRPPIVKDPYLFAMRATSRANGHTIATLVNWSDHPETLDRQNTEITSDYPHWVRAYMEQQFGGTAIFFSGSIGKVSALGRIAVSEPGTARMPEDGTWRKAELLGTELGRLAKNALNNSRQARIDSIVVRSNSIFIPMQNPLFRAAEATGVFMGRKPLYTAGKIDRSTEMHDVPGLGRVAFATGSAIQTEVDYVQLRWQGAPVAEIVTLPGEIYPELVNGGVQSFFGADFPNAAIEPELRSQLKSRYQFILGLGNDELGYLIPKAEWDQQPPWLLNSPVPFYGEINSAGPDAAGAVLHALTALINQ